MHPLQPNSDPSAPAHAPVLVDFRFFHRRSRTSSLLGWALVALLLLLLTTAARAQEQQVADSPIGSRQFLGTAVREGAIVWAGPSVADFRVATLSQGQEVVVVSGSGQFLRILPPEGTYCLVAKSRVNVRGDATPGARRTGRVHEAAPVRVGSRINGSIDGTSLMLAPGEEVTVIDEDTVYYHIVPPKNVFFYVERVDLAPVREVRVTQNQQGWRVAELPAVQPVTPPGLPQRTPEAIDPPIQNVADAAEQLEETDGPTEEQQMADGPEEADAPPVLTPPEPPAQPLLVIRFLELDARYTEAVKLPVEDQPLETLKQEYEALLAAATEDPTIRGYVSVIEARIQTIDLRQAALYDLRAIQAMRDQNGRRQQSLEAEQQELAERAKDARITVYTAVGQLQPSSLQVGKGVLYRLCDPETGRTIIYLRADGDTVKTMARHIEGFIGIKGEALQDQDLKMRYINVAEIATVDPQQVFRSVAAEIIPPSMLQNADAGQ